jgi:hypothetical protein
LDKLENNVVDCFAEKLNENEINDINVDVNDRRDSKHERYEGTEFTNEGKEFTNEGTEFTNERNNGIKGRNSKNRNSKSKYVDTTNEISNIFVSRLFARDRIKQNKIRSIQSNDKG